jgi:signal transduction histidine kinase
VIVPTLPDNERERLDALYSYGILDTDAESDFDELVKLASHICNTPISLITLIDQDRQWFKAKQGLDVDGTSREVAFCAHAIHQDSLMVVDDAQLDPRFVENPLVTGSPDIRFYAGMPLSTPTGFKLGTLCVIDTIPHHLTPIQREALEILGKQVMKLMELRRRNAEMNRLADLHKRLLSIIGHDLRGPTASIHNMLDLAMHGDLPLDEFKELLPDLQRSVDSSILLLNNLLEWASSQLMGRKVGKKPIPLKKLVDQIGDTYLSMFHEKGNEVVNALTEDHIAFGDRHMTEFILRNLLMNANKFMSSGTVTITATSDANRITLSISDRGPGIPPNVLQNLFSWESRTTTVGSAGERGSGLGLPMCHEFARSQGGELWAESTVNEGSVFHITLPTS